MASAAPPEGRVRITIHYSAEGRPAYLAAVTEDQPWRVPAREIITADKVVTWTLPAGRYRFVAGAPGFTTERTAILTLASDPPTAVSLDLSPLAAVSGKVVDAQSGAAIAGARVGLPGNFRFDYVDALSALAQEHLRANEVVTTDDDGLFTLPLHQTGTNFVYVEAEGYAPALLADVSPQGAPLGINKLQRGAVVVAHVKGTVPASGVRRLQLVPREVQLPARLAKSGAVALWTRAVTSEVFWRGVPAGSYEVWFAPPADDDSAATPVVLATFAVKPGERKALDVALPESRSETADHAASVQLLIGADNEALKDAQVVQWSDGSAPRIVAHTKHTVSGGTRIDVPAGCVPRASFVVTSGQMVAVSDPLGSGACAQTARPRVFRRAAAKVEVRAPAGAKLPARATMQLQPCGERGGDRYRVALPIELIDGRAAFPFPAGCFEGTLFAGRFAAVRLGRSTMTANESHDFGVVSLQEGGSLAGRIVDEGRLPMPDAVVEAYVSKDVEGVTGPYQPLAMRPVARTQTDRAGMVRVTGLPSGRLLLAVFPGEGRLPRFSEAFDIRAQQQLVLDDLILLPPATLDAHVVLNGKAPVALLSCLATPDKVTGWPGTWRVSAPAKGDACRFDDLTPGNWSITATARLLPGGRAFNTSAKLLAVHPGVNAVELDAVEPLYAGRVLRKGAPLSAGFITVTGPVGKHVARGGPIGGDGKFLLTLPEAGPYEADIRIDYSADRATVVRVPKVEFTTPDDAVEINLPDTTVSGTAVREDGAPAAAGLAVSLRQRSRYDADGNRAVMEELSTVTAAGGTFAFESVPPGAWAAYVRTPSASAVAVNVDVRDAPVPDVRLVVREAVTIDGRVADADGSPAAGATLVIHHPAQLAGDEGQNEVVETEMDGSFRFSVAPAELHAITNIQVVTPRSNVMAVRVSLDPALNLMLPRWFETAAFNFEGDWHDAAAYGLVNDQGAFLGLLIGGRHSAGQTVVVPKLPAGRYRLIHPRTPGDQLAVNAGLGALITAVAAVEVAPGAPVQVDVKSSN